MTEWALLHPAWLALWPLGILATWFWRGRFESLRVAAVFGLQAVWRHPGMAAAHRASAATRHDWRRGVAFAFVTLALAQPVRLAEPLPATRPAVDLHILLDTSVSMVLADYRQDGQPIQRLTFAKGLLDRLAAEYGGDRLSLYLVGSPSRRLLAPTSDHALFRAILARVEAVQAGRRAELGDALARLAQDLKTGPAPRKSLALLVTDGSQPSGQLTPAAGAARLAAQGVPLYVLAIGAGTETRDDGSGLLFDRARPQQLAALAEVTGGQGFAATDIRALQAALRTLTERHFADAPPPPARREPLYPWLLLLACGVLVLPAWHRPRKSQ